MRRGVVVEGQDQSKKEPQLKHGCYEVFRVKGLGIGPRKRGEKRRGRISKEKMGGGTVAVAIPPKLPGEIIESQ
jgi:hypothetical protein